MRLLDGDTFERGGRTFNFKTHFDEHQEAPWKREEGHGSVTDWVRRDKRPGEWLLAEHRGYRRYYDAQEAQKIALRDDWDAPPYKSGSRRQRAARAVRADFNRLWAWCQDRWSYIGITVEEIESRECETVWGIESDCHDYHITVADELADEINARLNDAFAAEVEASRPDMMIPPTPSIHSDAFWAAEGLAHV